MVKNREFVLWVFLFVLIYAVAIPVYGKESRVQNQGNILGFMDEIRNMEADYIFLENEIFGLIEECD